MLGAGTEDADGGTVAVEEDAGVPVPVPVPVLAPCLRSAVCSWAACMSCLACCTHVVGVCCTKGVLCVRDSVRWVDRAPSGATTGLCLATTMLYGVYSVRWRAIACLPGVGERGAVGECPLNCVLLLEVVPA